ncbi:FAD-binding protein [Paracoccus sp. (in: a-proteobacteria)]|uniref:FAD-binding protein n=1 Tax=Paracoccus sp. TaxID=267 RepID=UPI003A848EB4
MLAPSDETELSALLADRHGLSAPLRIAGGGSRVQTAHVAADTLTTTGLSGVVDYSPGEMTLIVRTGTPLSFIEALLAAEGQALAFEPPDLRAVLGGNQVSTIGGMVAANASGPRRIFAGACRDHLLGVRFVDGQGRIIKNGGRVMKNVTGLDLTKLMAGAHGTLGVLTQVALKTLPAAHTRATLVFSGLDEVQAVRIFCTALATPFEPSGAVYHNGTAWLRIEGMEAQLAYRRSRLLELFADQRVELLDDAATRSLWRGLRDLGHIGEGPLWRVLTRPTDAPGIASALRGIGGRTALDWGGGLIWYCGPGDAARIRAIAPHATLIRRGTATGPAFPPQTEALARLSSGLRHAFDPAGILNPGLMDA